VTTLHVVTANTPGAIALIQLHGHDTRGILEQLTGHAGWPAGRVRLSRFGDIDEGLAVALNDDSAQLMPHGGPRVVQLLVDRLIGLGCTVAQDPDPQATYPEAASPIEADVLHAIARAQSPAAIDLLADQPTRWRAWLEMPEDQHAVSRESIRKRSAVLEQLIVPPTVVVAGPANVGKSTLTNALMGRAVSIVADLPGTTRDWVGGVVELASGAGPGVSGGEIAVRWLDTPGLRASDDAVEQRAIALARSVVEGADVLIAMRDAASNWPSVDALPRTPDLWVVNKCDDADSENDAMGDLPDHPLRISAEQGHGLAALQHAVLSRLGLATLDDTTPWAFSKTLRAWARGEAVDLAAYLR